MNDDMELSENDLKVLSKPLIGKQSIVLECGAVIPVNNWYMPFIVVSNRLVRLD